MTHPHNFARNPSALRDRAAARRAMAVAVLRSDSSLANRLRRYNHHMIVARPLEGEAAKQQATNTRDPRTALTWLKAGKALPIDSLSQRDHLLHVRALTSATAPDTAEG